MISNQVNVNMIVAMDDGKQSPDQPCCDAGVDTGK